MELGGVQPSSRYIICNDRNAISLPSAATHEHVTAHPATDDRTTMQALQACEELQSPRSLRPRQPQRRCDSVVTLVPPRASNWRRCRRCGSWHPAAIEGRGGYGVPCCSVPSRRARRGRQHQAANRPHRTGAIRWAMRKASYHDAASSQACMSRAWLGKAVLASLAAAFLRLQGTSLCPAVHLSPTNAAFRSHRHLLADSPS